MLKGLKGFICFKIDGICSGPKDISAKYNILNYFTSGFLI